MRKLSLFILTTVLISLFLPLASAQCFSVKLSKSNYFSGETFQAEISGNPSKELTQNDIRFYKKDQEYFPAFDFEQVASDRWIVWTRVPSSYGENKLEVTALCTEEILRERTQSAPFLIQRPLQDAYSWLKSQVDKKWHSLSSDEISLAMVPLSYDKALVEEGKNALLSKSSGKECWPSAGCTVKSTSLSAIALKGSPEAENVKKWLIDAENNINLGLWDMILNSNSAQSCTLSINGANSSLSLAKGINQPISLALPDSPEVNLSVDCSLSGARVSHTYLGRVNDFQMVFSEGKYSLNLNNRKCWGERYRTQCDAESTAFALLAMKELGLAENQKEVDWLGQNLDSTAQRAVYYSFKGDSTTESWLINNQAPGGYWSKNALAISSTQDIPSTALAAKFLSGNAKMKGESWMKKIFEAQGNFGDLRETSWALQIFSADRLEPLISSRGLIKAVAGQNLTIKFSNNGISESNITFSILGSSQKTSVGAFSEKSISLPLPASSSLRFSEAEISYSTSISPENARGYKIPAVIFPSGTKESETAQPISGTSGVTALLSQEFEFFPKEVNVTVKAGEKSSLEIMLTSLSDKPITATITIFGLLEILENVEPSNFELQPGQTRNILVTFDTERAIGSYSGSISASSSSSSASLPVSLFISSTTASEASEQVPKETEEKRESIINMKVIGVIVVILAVLIAAAFIYLKLKKKQKSPLKIALEKVGRQLPEEFEGEI